MDPSFETNLDRLLRALLKFSQSLDADSVNTATLLQGRWQRLQHDHHTGLLTAEAYRIELTRLHAALLYFARNWSEQSATPLPAEFAPSVSVAPLPPAPDELPEPGSLPPGSRLPHPRNTLFTGRAPDLLALAHHLLHQPAAAGLVASGTGGLGKTQLAVEFCYRYERYFQGVHWLQADQDLGAEIAACGAEMDLDHWPEKQTEQVQATLKAWRSGGPRLLVLDNAEDPQVVQDWMPRFGPLRLLITSRRGSWPPDLGLQAHLLETLPRSESLALLRKLAPRLASIPEAALDPIPERLGDMPLALDLAGRYLHECPTLSPAAYLAELDQAGSALNHTSLQDWTEHSPTRHATSLAATFHLSWQQLNAARPVDALARRLFCLGGYCAPNTPIPLDLLTAAAGLPGDDPSHSLERALRRAAQLGLCVQAATGPSLHPLLAEFARVQDAAAQSLLPNLAEALADLCAQANESGLPARFLPLRPHLEAAAPQVEAAGLVHAGELRNALGYHLQQVAEFDSALAACERALSIDEAAFGLEHPSVARDINNLGTVLLAMGNLPAARAAFERALQIDKAAFGSKHPNVAIRINNLGSVLQAMGDLPAASKAYRRALRIDETALGPNHPKVAIRLNNLGRVLQDSGKLPAARDAFERALKIDEEASGPDHPEVAIRINNLGGVLQALGDLPAARTAYERALRIDKAAFGPDHPNVARDINNLGRVLHALDNLPCARAAFERALHIDEAVFGPNHPLIAIRLNNLGGVLQAQGELPAARAAFERALDIWQRTLPPDHPNIRIVRNNLASLEE